MLWGINDDQKLVAFYLGKDFFSSKYSIKELCCNKKHLCIFGTNQDSYVQINLPPNDNGTGYACYSRTGHDGALPIHGKSITQKIFGAADLDVFTINCRIISNSWSV